MADQGAMPQPPEICDTVFSACQDKAELPFAKMLVLGMLAGLYIGFGGLFATVALAGADAVPFGLSQLVAGVVFSLGLALVILAGAELFTGNTLMIGPVAAGHLSAGRAARALGIVYLSNFAGSVLLAVFALFAGLHEAGDGAVGRAALNLADTKTGKGFWTVLASGVLANMLVCLGVWLAYAGQSVTQKIAGLILPIAAFVAAGFEHSIANMYLLTYAFLVQSSVEAAPALLTVGDIGRNLLPATIGNILGGGLLALSYQAVYGQRSDAGR
jgi:formate transporter